MLKRFSDAILNEEVSKRAFRFKLRGRLNDVHPIQELITRRRSNFIHQESRKLFNKFRHDNFLRFKCQRLAAESHLAKFIPDASLELGVIISQDNFVNSFRMLSFISSVNSVVMKVPFHEFKNRLSEISEIMSSRFFSNISG